jgi:hypothetical protein
LLIRGQGCGAGAGSGAELGQRFCRSSPAAPVAAAATEAGAAAGLRRLGCGWSQRGRAVTEVATGRAVPVPVGLLCCGGAAPHHAPILSAACEQPNVYSVCVRAVCCECKLGGSIHHYVLRCISTVARRLRAHGHHLHTQRTSTIIAVRCNTINDR